MKCKMSSVQLESKKNEFGFPSENPFSRSVNFAKYAREIVAEFKEEVEQFCDERDCRGLE